MSNELWPSQPYPDTFSGRLQADQTLLELTDHDAEIDAQLRLSSHASPQSKIPRQNEDIDTQQQSNLPQGFWSRTRHGIDSLLRGEINAKNQQPQLARRPTSPQQFRHGARPSEALTAQQAFGARLSRTARVEGNTQAGNTRPTQQTNPDHATL